MPAKYKDRHRRSDRRFRDNPLIYGQQWLPLMLEADVAEQLGAWAYLYRWKHGPAWICEGDELPVTKYFSLELGRKAQEIVRECLYDLFEEGVVEPAFHRNDKGFVPGWEPIYQATKVYVTQQLTVKETAAALGITEKLAKVRIHAGLNIAITRLKPKALRDQIIRAVLGERLPKFTREEVARIIADEKSMGK